MRSSIAFIALLTVAFAGCIDSAPHGSASVYVKDAPTDEFQEIHVVFSEVRVHRAGEDSGPNATDGTWMTIFSDLQGTDVDLLAASGNVSAFLGEEPLPEGRYTQIVIVAEEAYGIDHDGDRVDFTVTNEDLRIVSTFRVVAGEESRILADYDLDRSLTQEGLTGEWRLNPVLAAVDIDQVDDKESGEQVHQSGELVDE